MRILETGIWYKKAVTESMYEEMSEINITRMNANRIVTYRSLDLTGIEA